MNYWVHRNQSLSAYCTLNSLLFMINVPVPYTLQWHHNVHDSISNHQPHDCLLNHLFRHRSKKTSKLHVTGLCARNSPGTGEFPAQMASYTENVSIWWRHHDIRSKNLVVMPPFPDVTLKCIFLNENAWISPHFSLKVIKFQLTIFQHGSDNGLALTRQQAIIWCNVGKFTDESLGLNELKLHWLMVVHSTSRNP